MSTPELLDFRTVFSILRRLHSVTIHVLKMRKRIYLTRQHLRAAPIQWNIVNPKNPFYDHRADEVHGTVFPRRGIIKQASWVNINIFHACRPGKQRKVKQKVNKIVVSYCNRCTFGAPTMLLISILRKVHADYHLAVIQKGQDGLAFTHVSEIDLLPITVDGDFYCHRVNAQRIFADYLFDEDVDLRDTSARSWQEVTEFFDIISYDNQKLSTTSDWLADAAAAERRNLFLALDALLITANPLFGEK